MELLQDRPLPMAALQTSEFSDHNSKGYPNVSEGRFEVATALVTGRSRILAQVEIECLQQSMEKALKRIGQESRKKNRLRIFRYYMPSLEEIKEHDESPSERNVDLTSLHKERAMNEGHYLRYPRSSRSGKSRKSKPRSSSCS